MDSTFVKSKVPFAGDLLAHLRMPLYRNAYALLLSGVASSGLGMLYWLLAARLYSATDVGLNSALISAMMLLSGLAQLSFYNVLVRFIPRAGPGTRPLVGYAYLISGAAGVVISIVFCLGLSVWAPTLSFLTSSPALLLGFGLSTLTWTVFALQDGVMTGLRQTSWVPLENILVAVGKIVLLLVLAGASQAYGIFTAWMVPVAASLLPINLLIFRRLIPNHIKATQQQAAPPAAGHIARYVAGNYLGTLFFLASTTLLPLIVVNVAGAVANAHFYIAWSIATGLQLVAINMTTSFTVEAARDQENLGVYLYRVLLQSMRILVPLVVLIVIGASFILSIFGKGYEEGATLLRLLALSAIPNMIIQLYISMNRVRVHVGAIALVQGASCLLLLGLSLIFLRTTGITGVGWASLISQVAVAALTLLTPFRKMLIDGRAVRAVRAIRRENEI